MQFIKMHGAGNDYVYVDCFSQPLPPDPARLAQSIADRRRGVGSDGLILICPAPADSDADADAEMRMYNADGSYSSMCGNGIRCVAKYLYDSGLAPRETLRIRSGDAVYTMQVTLAEERVAEVAVDMGAPIFEPAKIPTRLAGVPPLETTLQVGQEQILVTCLSMGNPHCVTFVEEATDELVERLGPAIECHEQFPERTNVEFVEVCDEGRLKQRTWERGSGETLACGTGACAACVAGVLTSRTNRQVTIELLGGQLQCHWREDDGHVEMTGPAVEVFTGCWNL